MFLTPDLANAPLLSGLVSEAPGVTPFPNVAVLYAREDSIYKSLSPHVYDINRDARNYNGPFPVVAHPPCRAWGRLRTFAKPRPDEKSLGYHAVHAVRTWGGVLEHPSSSTLWAAAGLPRPGAGVDSFGGWSIEVPQKWWGHLAEKNTWLYVVGVSPRSIPDLPFTLGAASHVVSSSSKKLGGREISRQLPKHLREATPPAFALWLLDLANACRGSGFLVTPGLSAMGGTYSFPVTPGLSLMGETE